MTDPVSPERLIDGETGKVVHPDSTITMPVYEVRKLLRELETARARIAELELDAEADEGTIETQYAHIDHLRAELAEHRRDGWVLVPKVMTPKMKRTLEEYRRDGLNHASPANVWAELLQRAAQGERET